MGFIVTTKGTVDQKLEYAFDLYDLDNNGYLDREEVFDVIYSMLDLFQTTKMERECAENLAKESFNELDTSKDELISKGK